MNKDQLKTPLFQSAAVILIGLICFGLVVSSGTDSLFGGIGAIIMGFINLILYAIALTVGVAFCIACLVAIFLASVYLFSKEQAAIFYDQLKAGLAKLFNEGKGFLNKSGVKFDISIPTPKATRVKPAKPASVEQEIISSKPVQEVNDLEKKVADLEAQIAVLQEKERKNSELLKELSDKK